MAKDGQYPIFAGAKDRVIYNLNENLSLA